MTGTLFVFALNMPVTVRHTDLTRRQGDAPELPPLARWLGADTLNTDLVELFPVDDLADLSLPDYLSAAYDVEAEELRKAAPRLRALGGSILLVPDEALDEPFQPGPEATEIARLPMPEADHRARLPKAQVPRKPASPPKTARPPRSGPRWIGPLIAVAFLIAAGLIWSLT